MKQAEQVGTPSYKYPSNTVHIGFSYIQLAEED